MHDAAASAAVPTYRHTAHYGRKHYVVTHKTGVHNVSQLYLPQHDRATATGNTTENLVNFGHMVFEICSRTDKQALCYLLYY